ncbi:hypothetical protein ACJ73_10259, partial [Blastomyces percursus]
MAADVTYRQSADKALCIIICCLCWTRISSLVRLQYQYIFTPGKEMEPVYNYGWVYCPYCTSKKRPIARMDAADADEDGFHGSKDNRFIHPPG